MFTGLIEEVGRVRSVSQTGASAVLWIDASVVLAGSRIGDSIDVNGVCLTITEMDAHGFRADVMPETMRRSNLGDQRSGSAVNLERAMAADGRFGGHIVSGHIDCVARVVSIERQDNARVFTLEAPQSALRYIVEKGSVALNGISLTVVDAGVGSFRVSVIPHSMDNTDIKDWTVGTPVNLECDIVAKYVERLTAFDRGAMDSDGGITLTFLVENGF